jgi:hypothetical protein
VKRGIGEDGGFSNRKCEEFRRIPLFFSKEAFTKIALNTLDRID